MHILCTSLCYVGACVCFGVAHYFIADPTLLCSDGFTGGSLDLSKKIK